MSITFKPTNKELSKIKSNDQLPFLKNIWGKRLQTKVEAIDDFEKQVKGVGYNGLYGAIISSFNDHVPLILSPDAIWLQIVQQLGIHIGENSEALRDMFVDFKDKKVIEVVRDNFIKGSKVNPWNNVFPEFADKIKGYIGEESYSSIINKFSTTTPLTQAAQEIALMDCMKSYFDYLVRTKCGIPEITLEGTKEDWQLILDKANGLSKYELGWWTKELVILLQEFVNVWDKCANLDFWENFVNENGGSGGPYFGGHMLKLSAYRKDYRNNISRISSWSKIGMGGGFTTSSFTSGISSVPFIWNCYETNYPMTFASGFVGIEIIDGAYKPNISWAVMNRKVESEELDKEIKRFNSELQSQKLESILEFI
jgi:hypothetical protein